MLFYLGIFAYFVVFPVIFAFFTSTAPDGVLVMTDISAYLSFVLNCFLVCLAFEVGRDGPVGPYGHDDLDALATKRPYIIVGAFVVGMLMTPPISSRPCRHSSLEFQAGLYFSRSIKPRSRNDEVESDEYDDLERELDEGMTEFEELGSDEDTPRN